MKTPTVVSTLNNVCVCVCFRFNYRAQFQHNALFFFAQLKYFPFADIFACF